MSLTELYSGVLLLSNPSWRGASTVPASLIRNITDVASDLGYEHRIKSNLTTLSTTNAQTLNGVIQALLYVPEIATFASCNSQQYDFIPRNVTRRSQLPPENYNLIAIAPWFSIDCVQAYLASARLDPIRGFIFYKPNNSSDKPQGPDSAVWNLDDGGAWKESRFPIFAIPGSEGHIMMSQLSIYSGTADTVPYGSEIIQRYGVSSKDYVRIWTQLTLKGSASLPSLWVYFLIVIGALLFIVASVSLTMHFVQRRRRTFLRRRVEKGQVDLEAMGIKRLTVPASHVKDFPLFTYTSQPQLAYDISTSNLEVVPPNTRRSKNRRRSDRLSSSSSPTVISDSLQTLRSKRSAVTGRADAAATNYQPLCQICLLQFQDRLTIIRELPCHHIFHPSCIDEFLLRNSSLCPMCKQCMLPRGYSPKITNAMVRRERALRRLRERVEFDDSSMESADDKLRGWTKPGWGKRFFHSSLSSSTTSPDMPLDSSQSRKDGEKQARASSDRSSTGNPPSRREAGNDDSADGRTPVYPATSTTRGTATEASPLGALPPSEAHFEQQSGQPCEPPCEQPSEPPSEPPSEVPSLNNPSAPAAIAPPPPSVLAPKKTGGKRKSKARPLQVLPTHPEASELRTGLIGRSSPSSFVRERMRAIANQNAPFDDPDQGRPKWRRAVTKIFPGL